MSEIKWYKRDPNAALVGMMCLTLEERGAYNTVLDLIYDNGGKVIDDDRFLAGWMRCDVRVWKRIKNRLLELNKLYAEGDFLRSYAADRGVSEALLRIGSAKEAGRASASKREAQSKENKEIAPTPVERPFQQPTTTPTPTPNGIDKSIPKEDSQARPPSIDYKFFMDSWNKELSPPHPAIRNLDDKRKAAIRSRMADTLNQDTGEWSNLLSKIKQSDFLSGQNDRGFTATFDWILKPTNMTKIIEGNYDNRAATYNKPKSKFDIAKESVDAARARREQREQGQAGCDASGVSGGAKALWP